MAMTSWSLQVKVAFRNRQGDEKSVKFRVLEMLANVVKSRVKWPRDPEDPEDPEDPRRSRRSKKEKLISIV